MIMSVVSTFELVLKKIVASEFKVIFELPEAINENLNYLNYSLH